MTNRLVRTLVVLSFLLAFRTVPVGATGFHARMQTVAGSGAIGYADGSTDTATFTYPVGIALGPHGSIYVADAGAQRIRVIENGRVRTVAGGGSLPAGGSFVRGAYADGRGSDARFNFPAGLAVDSRGFVYVADADNHCVRLIAPDGMVTTYSGKQTSAASTDGGRESATFKRPMGVALDSNHDIYVADQGVGLRKIAPDGTVTTVLNVPGATGVAISPDGRDVVVADINGSIHTIIDGSEHALNSGNPLVPSAVPHLGDLNDIGHPFAITMIDTVRAVYSDAKTGAIRYVDLYLGANKYLTGDRSEDGTNDVDGYLDGTLDVARAHDPLGVSIDSAGTLFFADSGNRRIRKISTLNFRNATIVPINALPPQMEAGPSKNVAFIGNSYTWDNCVWDDSWIGMLESRLRISGRRETLYPILIGAVPNPVMFQYIKETLGTVPGLSEVVFISNHGNVESSGANWRAEYVAGLRDTQAALAKNGIKLRVLIQPDPYDFDWQELSVRFLMADSNQNLAFPTAESPVMTEILAATKESGVPYLDITPYVVAEERKIDHLAVYGTSEGHPTDYGRILFANATFAAMTSSP